MAGRFPRPIPNLTRGEWDEKLRRDLEEFLRSAFGGLSALNGTPPDPTEIQAGVAADPGAALTPANSLHVHGVDTAAPSVPVALGGTSDEGSGSALMRADATLVLDNGGADAGDFLMWNGTAWVPVQVEDQDVFNWLNL